MAVGDLLFYLGGPTWQHRLISAWTHSQFVHVEIDVGNDEAIAASQHGITKHAVAEEYVTRWRYAEHITTTDSDDLPQALAWLHALVGTAYGWSDVAMAIIAPLKLPVYVVSPNRYHCSALATEFLSLADGVGVLGPLASNAHQVTPGMLARQLGVR